MEKVFINSDGKVNRYNSSVVTVLSKNGSNIQIRTFDDEKLVVKPADLRNLKVVPYKVGDKVTNIREFAIPMSDVQIPTKIEWRIESVDYLPYDNFSGLAVLLCYSAKYGIRSFFTSNDVI